MCERRHWFKKNTNTAHTHTDQMGTLERMIAKETHSHTHTPDGADGRPRTDDGSSRTGLPVCLPAFFLFLGLCRGRAEKGEDGGGMDGWMEESRTPPSSPLGLPPKTKREGTLLLV